MAKSPVTTAQILTKDTKSILTGWLGQLRTLVIDSRIDTAEVEGQATEFLRLLPRAAPGMRDLLSHLLRDLLQGVPGNLLSQLREDDLRAGDHLSHLHPPRGLLG